MECEETRERRGESRREGKRISEKKKKRKVRGTGGEKKEGQ